MYKNLFQSLNIDTQIRLRRGPEADPRFFNESRLMTAPGLRGPYITETLVDTRSRISIKGARKLL